MHRILVLAAILFAALSAPALADTYTSIDQCKVGTHVVDKANKTGVITYVNKPDQMCEVKLDGGGDTYYLFWMLRTAGASPHPSVKLVPGKYECFAGGRYTFMDIFITGPNSYRAADGGGAFHMGANNAVIFDSGSLKPYRAILKEGPSIGLNSNGDSFYGTTCELAK